MRPKVLSVSCAAIMALIAILPGSAPEAAQAAAGRFKPTPESLKSYRVPQWYEDAKLGIYFHWAPFSVPAYRTEWYPRWMYNPPGVNRRNKDICEHHLRTWGPLDKFGYKDFVPLFRAEKWDPQAWVSLFKEAGAEYVVSAAVHHDGFAMWDSKWIPFNSKAMGPRRDVVGEFTAAARQAGLKAGVSTHYGRHWAYYTFRPEYDTWDPRYEGLYGHRRGDNDPPRPEDEQHWQNVLTELIDKYEPDYIFVDGGIGDGERRFGKPYFRQAFYNVLAHYYNNAQQWGKGVVLTYKREFLEPDQAVEDFERAGLDQIRLSSKWQTDDKIAVNGWCYVEDTDFWPVGYLIGALVDTVSKNGNLLLNVGPKPDGTLREQEVAALREIGRWLSINGEAIYGSRPWRQFGEGTTVKIGEDGKSGKHKMGPDCVRFTVKNGVLYAICFGWPDSGTFTVKSLSSESPVSKSGIRSMAMLGSDESIQWKETPHGLEVAFPKEKPCDYAYVLKIVPNNDLLSQAPVSQPAIGPALDEAVPDGFVPLFSGINLDGWTVRSPENRDWQVVDGVIDCDPHTGPGDRNLWTTRSYGDFELLVDWRIKESPYINRAAKIILPNGTYKKDDSGREMLIEVPNTDSGVFLRGQHKSQVNIWCWPVGSGEVWGYRTDPAFSPEVRAGVTPKVRADRPIGQWNTFHILMKGDRLTITLNGQLVLNEAQLPGIPARGPIALQHHGDRKDGEWGASFVQFRRILIKELNEPLGQ